MNLLKELSEEGVIIKLETQQDKEEFYNWYIDNENSYEYMTLEDLNYTILKLWNYDYDNIIYCEEFYNDRWRFDYTWKQLKQKYKIGGIKMFKKEDLRSGKHWVETKDGEIGCVMENWIVFKGINIHLNNYDENLICKIKPNYNLVRILKLKPIGMPVKWDLKEHYDVVAEINQLKSITSLDQLEEVRKEMCEKYDSEYFYITNQTGEWEIRNNNEYFINNYGIYGDGYYTFDVNIDLEKKGYELKLKGGE